LLVTRANFLNHGFSIMSRRSKGKPAAVPSSALRAKGTLSLKSASRPAGLNGRWTVAGVCIFLAAIVWVVFGQTLGHGFVNYDDSLYVYENPTVIRGLNLKGIEWAFTHVVCANWHPVTMMSHMLDCQWYGLNAGGHHLTNVLLHTSAVILLFLVLRQMTGAPWRSAFVAAVFAIHPLRVESVAWVAERKDVLSGLFFMLTLWAYARYAQGRSRGERREANAGSSSLAPDPRPSTLDYWLVLLFFALGLMCKPMLVTLPLVLLLLDYWPLNRFRTAAATEPIFRLARNRIPARLVFEKLPLFGLAAASCMVTIFAQHEAIQPFENFSLPLRLGNAAVSYVAYLGQMFWPSGLAALYLFTPGSVGVSGAVLSLILLAGISTGVFILRRRRPCFLTGWLWYLIMLTPVIGIVQVGAQARADRYTYLPQIGLYLLLTWAVADLCAGWRHRRVVLGGGATIILLALILCARAQTACWRNSELLWTHTLACTSDNFVGHNNLGNALLKMNNVDKAIIHFQKALQIKPDYAEAHYNFGNALLKKGGVDEAIDHFQRALQIKPDYADAHNNLGTALFKKGNVDEAMVHYQKALQIKPDYADAHNNLGTALLKKGDMDEAIVHYQKALQIKPGYADAHYNLGNALLQKGRVEEAIVHYQNALQIKPDYAEAHNNLGSVLFQKGSVGEAIVHFQKALRITPDYAEAQNNLAWVLATSSQASLRNGNQAMALAQQANQLTGDGNPAFLGTLAAACAEAGRFPEAVATAQSALQLAETQSNPALAEAIRSQLKLYQAGVPFHSN
jgi:tetratricopeptide (TPR) repeat protein